VHSFILAVAAFPSVSIASGAEFATDRWAGKGGGALPLNNGGKPSRPKPVATSIEPGSFFEEAAQLSRFEIGVAEHVWLNIRAAVLVQEVGINEVFPIRKV
jgi:hypothetical protein